MAGRLLVDLAGDGRMTVSTWPGGGWPETVARVSLKWPLDRDVLEDLRWYLEDYLLAPFGVWADRARRSTSGSSSGPRRSSARCPARSRLRIPTSGREIRPWIWCSGPIPPGCSRCREVGSVGVAAELLGAGGGPDLRGRPLWVYALLARYEAEGRPRSGRGPGGQSRGRLRPARFTCSQGPHGSSPLSRPRPSQMHENRVIDSKRMRLSPSLKFPH